MKKTTDGFTIIEVIVIIVVIGILSTVGVRSYISIQQEARDSQRISRVKIIAEALEKYYDKNGEYPNCNTMTGSIGEVSSTLDGLNQEVLTTPKGNSGSNSIRCSIVSMTEDIYNYKSAASGPVKSYTIEFLEEANNTTASISSRKKL